jgi:hypothetical protein
LRHAASAITAAITTGRDNFMKRAFIELLAIAAGLVKPLPGLIPERIPLAEIPGSGIAEL